MTSANPLRKREAGLGTRWSPKNSSTSSRSYSEISFQRLRSILPMFRAPFRILLGSKPRFIDPSSFRLALRHGARNCRQGRDRAPVRTAPRREGKTLRAGRVPGTKAVRSADRSWRSAMFGLRAQELLIILIVLLLFGATRLPALGRSLGAGIRNFKKGLAEGDDTEQPEGGKPQA